MIYHEEMGGMMMGYIANQLVELIGNTPLLRLNELARQEALLADVVVKLEYLNP